MEIFSLFFTDVAKADSASPPVKPHIQKNKILCIWNSVTQMIFHGLIKTSLPAFFLPQ